MILAEKSRDTLIKIWSVVSKDITTETSNGTLYVITCQVEDSYGQRHISEVGFKSGTEAFMVMDHLRFFTAPYVLKVLK